MFNYGVGVALVSKITKELNKPFKSGRPTL